MSYAPATKFLLAEVIPLVHVVNWTRLKIQFQKYTTYKKWHQYYVQN